MAGGVKCNRTSRWSGKWWWWWSSSSSTTSSLTFHDEKSLVLPDPKTERDRVIAKRGANGRQRVDGPDSSDRSMHAHKNKKNKNKYPPSKSKWCCRREFLRKDGFD